MKKLPLFLTAAAFASMAVAQITPIVGDNVVGFAQLTAAAGSKTILTIPYEACLGEGAAGMLSDLVSTNGLTHAAAPGDADQLVVLVDDSGPKYNYYYLQTAVGWTGITTDVLQPNGTLASRTPPLASAFEISRGLGFWLKRPASVAGTSVYVQGQYTTAAQSTAITAGLNLIGVGSAESFSLNGGTVSWTGAQGGTGNTATADKIMILNESGVLEHYYYFVAPSGYETTYPTIHNKWVTSASSGALSLADVTIPAGQGFWYLRRGSSSFNFEPGL